MNHSIAAEDIEIIGSIDPDQSLSKEHIISVLNAEEKTLKHGEEFTGRPTTRIYTNNVHLVKFKSEYKFRVVEARRWITNTLEQERLYNVHHPSKTWFIIHSEDGGIIANITKFLTPLHMLVDELPSEAIHTYLNSLYSCYFRLVKKHEKRFDEGLSNWGLDSDDQLYYVDDDLYDWDDFTALSSGLGILLLKLPTLTPEHWESIGHQLRALIIKHFNDRHWITVLIELLKGVFIANDYQLECRNQLFKGLHEDPEVPISTACSHENEDGNCIRKKPITADSLTDVIAVFADVHANYPALEAVLDKLNELNIKQGIVLGDVVGYGPHPKECIDRLRNTDYLCIKGNHDHGIATGNTSRGFSNTARWVVDWSREKLDSDHLHWLENLPPFLQSDNWLALHGTPRDKTFFNAYIYHMTYEDNLNNLEEREVQTCFHGHTHLPMIYHRDANGDNQTTEKSYDLSQSTASLVCPGSVGKTRSNNPKAEFALFNLTTQHIKFYQLEYDLEKTAKDMEQQNFPTQLIERLRAGE